MVKIGIWIVLLIIPIRGLSTTHSVCKSCPINDLAKAVDRCENGDTITVLKGVYPVSELVIEKSLCIIGESGAVLDGQGKTILFIHHDNVTIKSLTLQNVATNYVEDRAAIKGNDSDHLQLIDLSIRSTFFGILLEKCDSGRVVSCTIEGDATEESYLESSNGNAIHLWYCKHMTIRNNDVRRHRDGIYFEFVENTIIENNFSAQNMRYGLHFMFSHENSYTSNTFKNNGAGVAVMYSDHVTMSKNRFIDNWGSNAYGLLLKDITDSYLEENVFRNNTIAISADNSSRITIQNNRFEKNGYALRIMGNCTDNLINDNDFVANSFDVTTNSRSNYNDFTGNYWDEYTGYDLDRNGKGDVPYRPVKLFTYIIAQSPASIILMRSTFIDLLNLAEKVTPVLTPETLIDPAPQMKPINDHLTVRT